MRPHSVFRTITSGALQLAQGPIARASGLSLGIRLCGLALSFVQAVLTARLLGPEGYGTVATILSVAQVLSTTSIFGLGALAVREIPAQLAGDARARLGGFLRLSLVVVLATTCSLAAGMALVSVTADRQLGIPAEAGVLGAVLVIPLAIMTLFAGWSRGFGRIANAQLPTEVIRPATMVAALGMTFIAGAPLAATQYLGWAIAAATLAAVLSGLWLWRSELLRLPRRIEAPALRPTMGAALPFLGLALLTMLQAELSTLLLATLAGPRETGLFQPIARLTPILALAVQAAGMRYAPRMAEFWQAGELDRISDVTHTFTWTTTLLTVLICVAIAASGPWLMLAFGAEFAAVSHLLWIMAAAQIFNAACGPVGMLLTMSGHTRAALEGQLVGVATLGIAGTLLVPETGATGAAIAMAAAIAANNLWQLLKVRQLLGLRPSLIAAFAAKPCG